MSSVLLPLLLCLVLVLLFLIAIVLLKLSSSQNEATRVHQRLEHIELQFERQERISHEEFSRNRDEMQQTARQGREENSAAVSALADSLLKRMADVAGLQKDQLDIFARHLVALTASNEEKLESLRTSLDERLKTVQEDSGRRLELVRALIDERLKAIQDDNAKKLEQMRLTVDEKLHDTLEKRLGESFKVVSERLEMVQRGLGEMQNLAIGVGDLKKVLTNVKTRGIFGEVQLASLLEQILAPGQFDVNVETVKGSGQRVEFAIKLPGRDGNSEHVVWLPLDAKFPQEDYLRLVEAEQLGDLAAVSDAGKMLERSIKESAKSIRDKYLDPPNTTDFGIMFIPTEGLYAEIIRRPGLFDALQRELKVMVAGPTTLAALLNSLQMGFRTLAIEKRSAEVWNLLGAVRTEFHKFGDILDKTSKKLQEAGNQIDAAAVKSRSIERKLKGVQELPASDANALLELSDEVDAGV